MDDEVLGCGGTIIRHARANDQVAVCLVANRAYGHRYVPELIAREKEACQRAKEILGYQEAIFLDLPDEQLDRSQIDLIIPLEQVVTQVKPDIVYLPHRGDLNQDHRTVFDAGLVACRPLGVHRVSCLRVYEVPSSTDQVPGANSWPFLPGYYVELGEALDLKIAALGCYEVESRPYPHPRSPEGLRAYARKRGMEVGLKAAEAFVILRDIWAR
jgi:LmbE family N-acetylglucosaminyl deacetylase